MEEEKPKKKMGRPKKSDKLTDAIRRYKDAKKELWAIINEE